MNLWDGKMLWINNKVLKDFFDFEQSRIYVYIEKNNRRNRL